MKLPALLFLIVISTTAFSQQTPEDSPPSDFHRMQIGINFSPDYCYRTLGGNDAILAIVGASRNEREIPKPGYTFGVNYVLNLSEHLGLEMGIQYSNKGYQTKMNELIYGDMVDPRSGYVYDSSVPPQTSAKFIYDYYYLDVPLKINFTVGDRKIRFITSAGVAANIFLKASRTVILELEDGTRDKNTYTSANPYNKLNISPFLSAGIDCKIGDRSNLRIEPTFRYGLLNIIDAPLTAKLWSAGLNVGYYLGF